MKRIIYLLMILAMALGAADWLTFGGDPQRTGWAREESLINKKDLASLRLQHAVKLNNDPRYMNGLTAVVVKDWVIFPEKGGTMVDIAIVGGASDKIFAINAISGKVIWDRSFNVTEEERRKSKTITNFLCPKAMNATPIIEATDWMKNYVYAVASNGKLYGLDIRNGREVAPPIQFIPPFAKPWSLNSLGGVIYTATSPGCGNDPASVYSYNPRNPQAGVQKFAVAPGGGGIWGRAGVVIDPETGKIYAETGDGPWHPQTKQFGSSVLTLSFDGLKLLDYYTPENYQEINSRDWDMGSISPAVFDHKGRKFVAASGKEGVIYLLDANQLGGSDHRTPLFKSLRHSNPDGAFSSHGMWGAFATWEDNDGERWLYVPSWVVNYETPV